MSVNYYSPELQLVGAAQNLVLAESVPQDHKAVAPCLSNSEDDPARGIYDRLSEW